MNRRTFFITLTASLTVSTVAHESYSGLRPSKKDLPYLLEAQRLIPMEIEPATESESKDGKIVSVPGKTSSARTPLPEPIFIFAADKISADQLVLYHFHVNDGRREAIPGKQTDDDEDLRLTLRNLDQGLYRLEASHMLEPGEYGLLPQGGKQAFCFEVY